MMVGSGKKTRLAYKAGTQFFKSKKRLALLPKEHRLYSSPATLAGWPKGDDVGVDYDSLGWHVTRPPAGKSWNEYEPLRLGRVSAGVPVQRRYRDSTLLAGIPPHWLHGVFMQPIARPQYLHAADRKMRRLRWRDTGDISLLRPTGVPILEPRRRDAPAIPPERIRYRGGYPGLHWLAKREPAGALAMLQYIRALSPSPAPEHDMATPLLADNDNDVHDVYAHDGAGEAPVLLGFSEMMPEDEVDLDIAPEHLHVIKPSVNEIFADMLRVRFVRYSDGQTHSVTGRDTRPVKRKGKLVLAGMTFWRNPAAKKSKADPLEMQSYTDSAGRAQEPRLVADKPKGGKSNHRSDADIARYLSLRGAVASPLTTEGLRTPMSGETVLMPMLAPMRRRPPNAFMDAYGKLDTEGRFGVEEAREYLKHYGVDGSVAFENLPFPATRYSPRRAKGARFIGGMTGSKPTKTMSGPAKVAELAPVTSETAIVLEEVAARGNLASIGRRLGKRGGYADRFGKQALLAAADELLAANDNGPGKIIAA